MQEAERCATVTAHAAAPHEQRHPTTAHIRSQRGAAQPPICDRNPARPTQTSEDAASEFAG
eukprot:12675092-Alexandrium_andersonii.AAC.1